MHVAHWAICERGADGSRGTRSAMSLANLAWMTTFTWGNPVLVTVEQQALVPLFLEFPLEMGAHYVIDDLLDEFADDDVYAPLFEAAFPDVDDPFQPTNVARAISAFERTLISSDSPYDAYLAGDEDALTEAARRGLDLFESSRLSCSECHSGPFLTAAVRSEDDVNGTMRFENTGLYDEGEDGGESESNT